MWFKFKTRKMYIYDVSTVLISNVASIYTSFAFRYRFRALKRRIYWEMDDKLSFPTRPRKWWEIAIYRSNTTRTRHILWTFQTLYSDSAAKMKYMPTIWLICMLGHHLSQARSVVSVQPLSRICGFCFILWKYRSQKLSKFRPIFQINEFLFCFLSSWKLRGNRSRARQNML